MVRYAHLGEDYSVWKKLRSWRIPGTTYRLSFLAGISGLLRIDAIDETAARGELMVRSKYDVYLEGRNLIYIRKPCLEDEEGLSLLFACRSA